MREEVEMVEEDFERWSWSWRWRGRVTLFGGDGGGEEGEWLV